MAVACTSRFACLKLEDDEFCDSVNKSNSSAVQNGNQAGKNKTNAKSGSNDLKSKSKKKKKNASEIAEVGVFVLLNYINKVSLFVYITSQEIFDTIQQDCIDCTIFTNRTLFGGNSTKLINIFHI